MARLFDDGSTEYLEIDSAVAATMPFAMACLFNSNDDTISQALLSLVEKGGTRNRYILLAAGHVGGDPIRAFIDDGTAIVAATSSGFTANTWHHAACMFLNATERHVYIDGGSKGSETTSVSPADIDRTSIGRTGDTSPTDYMSGLIAEAAIWDLTDWGANDAAREVAFELAIASMAKGFAPLHFPLGLLGYWPLVRGLNDYVGGFNMTASGTVVSAHPRIIYPGGIWVPHKAAAVVGAAGIMTTNTGYWGPTF